MLFKDMPSLAWLPLVDGISKQHGSSGPASLIVRLHDAVSVWHVGCRPGVGSQFCLRGLLEALQLLCQLMQQANCCQEAAWPDHELAQHPEDDCHVAPQSLQSAAHAIEQYSLPPELPAYGEQHYCGQRHYTMEPRLLQSAAPCGRRPQSCQRAWSSTAQPLSPKLPACAGVLKTLLLYPMELAYTRLAADATPRGQPVHYFGMLHCIVQVAPTACASGCSKQACLKGCRMARQLVFTTQHNLVFASCGHHGGNLPGKIPCRLTAYCLEPG